MSWGVRTPRGKMELQLRALWPSGLMFPTIDSKTERAAAEKRVGEMCDKLLANTVIETYHVEFI